MSALAPASTPLGLKVGVFGGAFDPPHLAHVALAQCAIEQLQLDVLHVLPTGQAWHKSRPLSSAVHRLAMAHLAFDGLPRALVDPRETQRSGPTYTIDTLVQLRAEYSKRAEKAEKAVEAGEAGHPEAALYLILGADQAASFAQWHRAQDIAAHATICVAERDHSTLAPGLFSFKNAFQAAFLPLQMPSLPISATEVRQRAASCLGVEHLVGPSVARYIEAQRLYENL